MFKRKRPIFHSIFLPIFLHWRPGNYLEPFTIAVVGIVQVLRLRACPEKIVIIPLLLVLIHRIRLPSNHVLNLNPPPPPIKEKGKNTPSKLRLNIYVTERDKGTPSLNFYEARRQPGSTIHFNAQGKTDVNYTDSFFAV